MTVPDIVLALSVFVAPLCAAALNLAPSRRLSLLLLLGVFTAAGATIGLSQQIRIGLGIAATGMVACALLAFGFQRSGWQPRRAAGGLAGSGRGFRAATVLLVAAAAWGLLVPYASSAGAISAPRLASAVMILSMGLLQLGLSQEQGAAALGLLFLMPHSGAVVAGFLLLAAIALYNIFHKEHPSAVVLMAGCRLMIFVVSSISVAGSPAFSAILAGGIHFVYIFVISVTARYENRLSKPFDFPVIPVMIAGISVLDGILMAAFVSPAWLSAGIVGALLTHYGQKFIRGD